MCVCACVQRFFFFFQRCYCTVFSSSINHSVQLAQFSLNFLLSGKSSAPTAQTPVWPTTQTPRKPPPPPRPLHPTAHASVHGHNRASAPCGRVGSGRLCTCHLSFFSFFVSFPPFISSLPLSASSVGRPRPFPFPPQVPFVYHSNGIKLGEVITAY